MPSPFARTFTPEYRAKMRAAWVARNARHDCLSAEQKKILALMAAARVTWTTNELARELNRPVRNVARSLRSLLRRGLVERLRSRGDRQKGHPWRWRYVLVES